MLDIRSAVSLLGRIGQVVRLNQDLIIVPFDPGKRVMMTNQISDPLFLGFGHAGIGQKCPDDGRTFFFLQFSVSTAVFFTAEGTGNVVDDGGRLQQILSVRV